MSENTISKNAKILIAVAALGYFVDVYDLILFGVVRKASLMSIGITDLNQIRLEGDYIFNWQMFGMLLGGILWGVLGDKKGRKSVLFGSILLYSLANAANGFVHSVPVYAFIRFLAGIGLAGELGAGVTLVNETLPKEKRGIGTLLIAGTGALGAVFAQVTFKSAQNWDWVLSITNGDVWRFSYVFGGLMGLMLLLLRLGTFESKMFQAVGKGVSRGDFLMLFRNKNLFFKYLCCFLIGIPVWYVVAVLVIKAPEISKALGVEGITGGEAIMYCYIGLSVGDFGSGLVSQLFKSRKKTIYLFLILSTILMFVYLNLYNGKSGALYWLCFLLGTFGGYWAMFVTMSSEQFGTNLRATVTTTIPNFVRGAVILINIGFETLIGPLGGVIQSALFVGTLCIVLAFWANSRVEETFYKDLDFVE
jgi:MFS transporter, putative metabolite:H+ symporter